MHPRRLISSLMLAALFAASCSSSGGGSIDAVDTSAIQSGASSTFVAEVWADNWFSLTVNNELVGEDSVSITTERSFNAETFTFDATYPLTIAVEAKDFKETDSGLEYIGENNQQMGDGGLILQIVDQESGAVVAVTSDEWHTLVIHEAPSTRTAKTQATLTPNARVALPPRLMAGPMSTSMTPAGRTQRCGLPTTSGPRTATTRSTGAPRPS